MFTDSRNDTRKFFFEVWARMKAGEALEDMAGLVGDVIALHPEYHATLDDGHRVISRDLGGAEPVHNPFLHMGLHIALREQLAANRPAGIAVEYARLREGTTDIHAVEHRMIECLASELWRAQASGQLPDERAYLAAVAKLRLRAMR